MWLTIVGASTHLNPCTAAALGHCVRCVGALMASTEREEEEKRKKTLRKYNKKVEAPLPCSSVKL